MSFYRTFRGFRGYDYFLREIIPTEDDWIFFISSLRNTVQDVFDFAKAKKGENYDAVFQKVEQLKTTTYRQHRPCPTVDVDEDWVDYSCRVKWTLCCPVPLDNCTYYPWIRPPHFLVTIWSWWYRFPLPCYCPTWNKQGCGQSWFILTIYKSRSE